MTANAHPEAKRQMQDLAHITFRGMGSKVDRIKVEGHYKVVKISTLPHPPDAELVPIITIQRQSK